MICLTAFALCFGLAACGIDNSDKQDKGNKSAVTTASTEEPATPSENPMETSPSAPTQSVNPTLPDEGQDPGGFGAIF